MLILNINPEQDQLVISLVTLLIVAFLCFLLKKEYAEMNKFSLEKTYRRVKRHKRRNLRKELRLMIPEVRKFIKKVNPGHYWSSGGLFDSRNHWKEEINYNKRTFESYSSYEKTFYFNVKTGRLMACNWFVEIIWEWNKETRNFDHISHRRCGD